MKLARYLLCATEDGHYGDGLERVLYNTILAAKEPDSDGDYPYYSTYSARANKVYYPKKWPCCSGTLIQGVADYVKNIYFRAQDGVAVNLYAPSEVRWSQDGATVALFQQTGYPLEQTVILRVECSVPVSFTLRLRIPGWLERAANVHVNGKPVVADTQRGFAVLRRGWKSGDTVTLELPQSFRTEAIDDLHPDTVAVLRGPLLYVQLNPPAGRTRMVNMDGLRPTSETLGMFCSHGAGRESLHAPFYFVRQESYTTYFEKGS
jgi:DUF1680 family protein